MSYAVDVAGKLHQRQVAAATMSQNLFFTVVEKVADLQKKALKASESVTVPLEQIVGPITKVVGSPSEVAQHLADSSRDWVALQQQYQNRLLEVAARNEVRVAAKRATRKSAAKPSA